MMAKQCSATTKAGERCKQYSTVNESGMCVMHDPARKSEMAAIRSRGGKTTAQKDRRVLAVHEVPDRPKTMDDLREWSLFLVWASALEMIAPRTCDSTSRAIKVAMDACEGSEFQARLAELEATIAEVKRSGMRVS